MAFKLHKSTRDPVRLPLASDPAVDEANGDEAIKAYIETGDYSALTIPSDATWVIMRPLTAKERVGALEAVRAAGNEGLAALMAYAESAFPLAIQKVEVEGVEMSIVDLIDSIEGDATLVGCLSELMGHLSRISGISLAGKARSGPRAG